MARVLLGKWDDLVKISELSGHTVQVVVFDDQEREGPLAKDDSSGWLKALQAWAESHEPIGHPIDDSRESMYSGTIDDPR